MTGKNIPDDRCRPREAMPFPFRWRKSLLKLPDGELRTMLTALLDYAENRTEPEFSGATAALWEEFADRIDHDREQYAVICGKRRENALKRWQNNADANVCQSMQKHTAGCKAMQTDAKHAQGDGDGDGVDNITEASKYEYLSASSPKPHRSGASGTKSPPGKIFFDYTGDSRLHGVTPEQLALWSELFPALDVENELRKAGAWLDGHRKNRKYDVKKFLANWLNRAQEKAPPEAAFPHRGRSPVDFARVNEEVERMRENGCSAWDGFDENGKEVIR